MTRLSGRRAVVSLTGAALLASAVTGCQVIGGGGASSCRTDVASGTDLVGFDRFSAALTSRFGPVDQVMLRALIGGGYQWEVHFAEGQPAASEVRTALATVAGGKWVVAQGSFGQSVPYLFIQGPDLPAPWATPGNSILFVTADIMATDVQQVAPDLLVQACMIMADRVADLGIGGFVQTGGGDTLQAFLPADRMDESRIRSVLTTTGRIDFVPIPDGFAVEPLQPLPDGMDTTPLLLGSEIASATVPDDPTAALQATIKENGRRLLDEWAAANPDQPLAVVLDGSVLGVTRPVADETLRIPVTGDQARDLAVVLEHGSYPLEVRETGATLLVP